MELSPDPGWHLRHLHLGARLVGASFRLSCLASPPGTLAFSAHPSLLCSPLSSFLFLSSPYPLRLEKSPYALPLQNSGLELEVEDLSASCFLDAHNSPRTKKTEVRAQVPLSASLPVQHGVGPGAPRPLLDLGYSHLSQRLLCPLHFLQM